MELADLPGLQKVQQPDGTVAWRYPYRVPAQDGRDKFDDTLWWYGEDGIAAVTVADVHDEMNRRYQNWISAISPPAPTAEDYVAQAVDLGQQIADLTVQQAEAVQQAQALDPNIEVPLIAEIPPITEGPPMTARPSVPEIASVPPVPPGTQHHPK